MNGTNVMSEQCVANISAEERRKRLVGGIIGAVFALAGLAAMLAWGAGRQWRLVLFLPLWGAAVGFFQAREHT